MAFNAKIVPVRVLGNCGGYDSDIADAIIWASGGTVTGVPANANPAEVINLSLGGSGACGATTQAAINSAVGRGTTLVIAAGNDNANVSECLAGELRQRHRRGLDHQHRRAFELLELRHADRHRRAGLDDPVDAQHRHDHAGRAKPTPATAAPRWPPRTWRASSR